MAALGKISVIGNLVVVTLVLVVCTTIGGGWLADRRMEGLSFRWNTFEADDRTSLAKTKALGDLRDALGYGGLIHSFKNYVLRRDERQFETAVRKVEAFHQVLARYYQLAAEPEEVAALNTLQAVVGRYEDALFIAQGDFGGGKTVAEVDAVIRIDDKPALEALRQLEGFVNVRREDNSAAIREEVGGARRVMIAASLFNGILLAMVAVFLIWFTRIRLVRPLVGISGAMGRLATGDKDIDLAPFRRGDEIGDMARALGVFRDNALEMESMRGREEQARRQAEDDRRAQLRAIADKFERDVSSVVELVSNASRLLQRSAKEMVGSAEMSGERSVAVAASAEQATANVQTVASAAEELTASIGEIGRQVAGATGTARKAVAETGRVNELFAGLVQSAEEIGQVVGLINLIAGQTNLLALNATIEAARAGEAGKGFAVVAAEVKNLANQTARATEDIARQVDGIQGATRSAVEAIKGIDGIISDINAGMAAIAAAMEQQEAATAEISRNVLEAADGTRSVSAAIGDVSEAAGRAREATEEVLEASIDLSRQADLLRAGVETFMREIRA